MIEILHVLYEREIMQYDTSIPVHMCNLSVPMRINILLLLLLLLIQYHFFLKHYCQGYDTKLTVEKHFLLYSNSPNPK